MVAAIFVLELDAVRGVVGIGDFTVYVSDGDGCHGTTYLNDVDIARKEVLKAEHTAEKRKAFILRWGARQRRIGKGD